MINFTEYLKEVFDSSLPFYKMGNPHIIPGRNPTDRTLTTIYYRFETSSQLYTLRVKLGTYITETYKNHIDINLYDANHDMFLTGKNTDQFKVYSTIYAVIKAVGKEYNIKGYRIDQTGVQERQDKLYAKLMKYFEAKGLIYMDSEGVHRIK